ncbi:MAG: thiamine phosphate synthase [Magnetococcales bacterium]|nr:thiamine phosphate synthase [Magnetococcales bacterium]
MIIGGIYPILDDLWLEQSGYPALHREGTDLQRDVAPAREIAAACGRLKIPVVQLRSKTDPARQERFMRGWCALFWQQAPDISIILNDRPDLVPVLGADGVHVGQGDTDVAACRRMIGDGGAIGLSTHFSHEIREAITCRADYIGFGPIFATATKPDTEAVRGIDRLKQVCSEPHPPLVAIGGITLERLPRVIRAGADAAAMIGALFPKQAPHRLDEAVALWRESEADV